MLGRGKSAENGWIQSKNKKNPELTTDQLSGKESGSSRAQQQLRESDSLTPVSVNSSFCPTESNAAIIGHSLQGRSRLDLEESACCEVPFHGDHVPDLAQVNPRGGCKQLANTQTHTQTRIHPHSHPYTQIFIPNTHADFHFSALTSMPELKGSYFTANA